MCWSSNEKAPEFDNVYNAAKWLRKHTDGPLTNESFREKLSELMKRPLRDEEAVRARVISCPWRRGEEGFITKEEDEEMRPYSVVNKEFKAMTDFYDTEKGTYFRVMVLSVFG